MTEPAPAIPKNFELLTNEDRQKIITKLKDVPRDLVTKFIYENKRKEWALSYEGTKWVVREMADKGEAIRTDGHPKVERCQQDPEWMTCSILGKRVKVDREGKCEMVLDTNVGTARSWVKQKIGKEENSKVVPDEFWFSKVVSKATRNLFQSMIPTDLKKAVIVRLQEIQAGKAGGPAQKSGNEQQGKPAPAGTGSAPAGQQPGQQPGQKPAGQGQPNQQTQQTAQKPAGAPAGSTTPQKPSQGTAGPQNKAGAPPSLEAVQLGFRAVFLQFAKTEDKPTLQKILKALTGKTAITDLEQGLMVELGPLLRRAIKSEVKWNGTSIHDLQGDQLWPKQAPQPEPPFDEPPPQEEGPPPQEPPPMF